MYAKTKATTDDPVRRSNDNHDHLCSYNTCRTVGAVVRITAGGQGVLYCDEHAKQAFRTFGTK